MRYANLTWPEIKQAREEDYILLLPVGSIEEHGPHLPVGTDDFFAQRWANESAKMAREDFGVKTIVLPSIHYCFWEEAAKIDSEAAQGCMINGGSLETAKMLDTHPELVRKEKYPLKLEESQRKDLYFMDEVSSTGSGGDPSKATVKAGSLLWSYLISNLAKYLKELSE